MLALAGLVWIGQGLGYIPGSFMTGDQRWAAIGLVLLVLAVIVVTVDSRRRSVPPA